VPLEPDAGALWSIAGGIASLASPLIRLEEQVCTDHGQTHHIEGIPFRFALPVCRTEHSPCAISLHIPCISTAICDLLPLLRHKLVLFLLTEGRQCDISVHRYRDHRPQRIRNVPDAV